MKQKLQQTILLVIPGLEIGGAQTNLMRLASEFYRQDQKVIIINTKPNKWAGDRIESILHDKIPVFSPPFFLRNKRLQKRYNQKTSIITRLILKLLPESLFLRYLIYRKRVSVIHSHMYLADLYLSKNLKQRNIPRLLKICGCYLHIEKHATPQFKTTFRKQIDKIFKDINGIVIMTDAHSQFLLRHNIHLPRKIIFNGIEMPQNKATEPKSTIRSVMCSRGEPTKGWEAAIKGTILAHNSGADVQLDLIGYGPHLEQLLTQHGSHPAISSLGQRNNPASLYHEYDIGILPSTFGAECRPNTSIEYQASGLAIIGTRHGEIDQVIASDNTISGTIIEPGSQDEMAQEICHALLAYHEDISLLQEHKENALLLRTRFDIRRTAKSYLEFSHSLEPSES